ncbi:MAG: DegV family protein [Bacillota bacterium]|nr:DegV family protein [Bacillota bacterium]
MGGAGRVGVVTDSCSGVSPEMAQALGIEVVPLTVIFGEEAFLDGVDIDTAEFYARMARGPVLPRTSQPSPARFLDAFSRLAAQGASGVVVVTVAGALSGTYQSALRAAADFSGLPVEVVDSGTASLGQMFAVLAAAEVARKGSEVAQVVLRVREVAGRTRLYGVLETLEYLRLGGRIGRAAAWTGSLLQIKPVLALGNGDIVPVARLRTRARAVEFMLSRVEGDLRSEPGGTLRMGVVHSACPREAGELAEKVRERFVPDELVVSELTPVMGAHAGPGVLGVAFYRDWCCGSDWELPSAGERRCPAAVPQAGAGRAVTRWPWGRQESPCRWSKQSNIGMEATGSVRGVGAGSLSRWQRGWD